MAALMLSSPSLSSPFLGRKLSLCENSKRSTICGLNFKSPRCAVDTPYEGKAPKFPRINIWDPYKRLGISSDASEEEIWGSRNFLLDQYVGHERSAESIEAAFEKILMASFRNRKKTKINLKSRLKKKVEESPPWVKNLLSFVELPPTVIILRRLFLFAFMAGWSIMNSAESGPAFQVAVSLAACIYFLNDKTKSLARASVIGFGSLVVGWFCGSLVVPMIPSVLVHPTWTLELLTSLGASTCDYFRWIDPPICECGTEVIPKLLEKIDKLEMEVQNYNVRRGIYKQALIRTWIGVGCLVIYLASLET